MLSRLSSLISTYVTPSVSSGAGYLHTHQVEVLAVGIGVVALLLTVLVALTSSWQPTGTEAPAEPLVPADKFAITDVFAAVPLAAEDLPPAEEFPPTEELPPTEEFAVVPFADDELTFPAFLPVAAAEAPRPVLASVQDVLPGMPMRFAPEVALPGRTEGTPRPFAAPFTAPDAPFAPVPAANATAEHDFATPPFAVPEPRRSEDGQPEYQSAAPELLNAFAELSQLSSAGRRAAEQRGGAA